MFLAAVFSSFALFHANANDLNLIKVIIYPRAIEAVYNLLKSKGIIKPIKYGETLSCLFTLYVCTYCYIFEPYNIGESYVKTVNRYSDI